MTTLDALIEFRRKLTMTAGRQAFPGLGDHARAEIQLARRFRDAFDELFPEVTAAAIVGPLTNQERVNRLKSVRDDMFKELTDRGGRGVPLAEAIDRLDDAIAAVDQQS